MSRRKLSCLRYLSFVVFASVSFLLLPTAVGQSTQSAASAVLTQAISAFSGGQQINNVQITGNVQWYTGDAQDSGNATLTAAATGASTMQLGLANAGSWTESQSDFGVHTDCQWAANDGIAHDRDYLNCLRPVVWFLPLISLQSSSIPTSVGVADLGAEQVGPSTYEHLQCQAFLQPIPADLLSQSVTASTTDIWLDPATLMPAILQYHMHPDGGELSDILMEIRYADYRNVNGALIPFSVQRLVNGSLVLEIQVISAQVS
jgi:hypothetical protein